MHGKNNRELKEGASELGLCLNDSQIEKITLYLDVLYQWNSRINLTRVPVEHAVSRHVLDSLSAGSFFLERSAVTLLDVGSGAGLPAIPLKIIFPSLRVTLIESNGKKVQFLKTVIKELSLSDIEVLQDRAEVAAHASQYRECFDCVTARAVAELPLLAELVLPFVKINGSAVLFKAADCEQELIKAEPAIEKLGGSIQSQDLITIPYSEVVRRLIVLQKGSSTHGRYPRNAARMKRQAIQ